MSVKGFKLSDGTVVKYDYSSLDNIVTDSTLSVDGVAADAGAVGDELLSLQNKSFDLDELDRLKLTGLSGTAGQTTDKIAQLTNAIGTEASARMAADTALSNSISAETSARAAADAGLASDIAVERARISNIVAGTTPGADELVDIRVGDDGITYSTAGDAVRGQFANVKQDFGDLLTFVSWTDNKFISINGNNTVTENSGTNWHYATYNVNPVLWGSSIDFSTVSTGNGGCVFEDANGNILAKMKPGTSSVGTWANTLTIPNNSTVFKISNYNNISALSISKSPLTSIVTDKYDTVSEHIGIIPLSFAWVKDNYIKATTGATVSSAGYAYAEMDVSNLVGKSITFSTYANSVAGCAFYDENNVCMNPYGSTPNTSGLAIWTKTVIVPNGAKYFRVSCYGTGISDFTISVEETNKYINRVANKITDGIGNGYSYGNWTDGYFVKKTGVLEANARYSYLQIDVQDIQSMQGVLTSYTGGGAGYSFYDSNDTPLIDYNADPNGASLADWTVNIEVPPTASYLRVSCYTNNDVEYANSVGRFSLVMENVTEFIRRLKNKNDAFTINHYVIPTGQKITTPTYDGSNQATHPKVLYFPSGWNGYKYWMALTPYPYSNDDYENPQILVSNDGYNFSYFPDCPNPLFTPPDVATGGHYSDTHLLFYNNELYCIFRYNPANSSGTGVDNDRVYIYYTKSSDGKTWSSLVTMIDDSQFTETKGVLSPVVIYDDNKFKLWFSSGSHNKLYYLESSTLTGWTSYQETSFSQFGIYIWHQDIVKTSKGYEMIFSGFESVGGSLQGQNLYYSVSSDGVTWSEPVKILEPNSETFATKCLYRSTFVLINGIYYLYYAGYNDSYVWGGLGVAKGTSLVGLIGTDISGNYLESFDVGSPYFDTVLNKPIWRAVNNNGWVDANGEYV